MQGQMSLFDLEGFVETTNRFNVLESLALRGTGFRNGMQRVREFFLSSSSASEKAAFLKKEYGLGGFSTPTKKPCMIKSAETFNSKGVKFAYYDEECNLIESMCSWNQLAEVITGMVRQNTYNERNRE